MNKLIIMVGLPRSGKTTWAIQQNLPIVSKDAIRIALHGQRFLSEAEEFVDTLSTYMVKSLFLAGNKTVIVDDCHNTEKRRERWLNDNWRIEYKIIPTTEEECIRRAMEENDVEIIPVIKRMSQENDSLFLCRSVD
jgi:predicted kinase